MAPRLYRSCLRLTPVKSEADDLLQETMLRPHRAHCAYEQLRTALDAAGWKEHDHDGSWNAVPVRV